MTKPKLVLTKPIDESFEAFVAWMKTTAKALGIPYTISDEVAREKWEKYKEKAKKVKTG